MWQCELTSTQKQNVDFKRVLANKIMFLSFDV